MTIAETWPCYALMVRGTATSKVVDGLPPESVAGDHRYMGDEQGDAWVANVNKMSPQSARISIRPQWVAILDFDTR